MTQRAASALAGLVLGAALGLAGPAGAAGCKADTTDADKVIKAANALRAGTGAPPLTRSTVLTNAARAHACDMALNNFFDHKGSDGSTPLARIRRAGCRPRIAAENLAWGYRDPAELLARWRESAGHRKNLLLPKARQAGLARAAGGGKTYWVMVFGAGC